MIVDCIEALVDQENITLSQRLLIKQHVEKVKHLREVNAKLLAACKIASDNFSRLDKSDADMSDDDFEAWDALKEAIALAERTTE